jgi:hypothetical protein
VGVKVVEPVIGVVEELLELAEPGRDAPVRDLEQLGLRAVDGLLDLGGVLVADPRDLARGADEVPQDRLALDDPGVLDGMDRGRRLVRQLRQVRPAADLLEVLAALEGLGDRDKVNGLAPLEELEHRAIDRAMGLPVEVLRLEEFGDLDDRLAVDQDRAEDGLLGLETVRRQAVDHYVGASVAVVTPSVSEPCPGSDSGLSPTYRAITRRPVDAPLTACGRPVDAARRREAPGRRVSPACESRR